MVFKKPYGFLIKHFKLIHLILGFIYIYLAMNVNGLLTYYRNFIDGSASKLDALNYVNSHYAIAIILSFIICLFVFILMRYKKKPVLLYIILFVIYTVVGIMIHIVHGGLQVIYISILATKTLRLYRDILRIMILFQYATIVFVMFRGLGFDIKKFNFASDVVDLDLSEEDEEEIEIVLGGTQALDRKIHRKFREFKYYYLENKYFFFLIGIVLLVIAISSFYVHHEVIYKVYKQGDTFSTDQYRFQVTDTFVTNRDINNNVISDSSSFVVVRMNIGTNYGSSEFNTSNLILKVGNKTYSINNRYANRFSDLGVAYRNTTINGARTYLFIYTVPNDNINGDMILDYAGMKTVKLNPNYMDKNFDEKKIKVGDTLDLASTSFGSGYFKILSYELQKEFNYSYEYEIMGQVNTGNLTLSGSGIIMKLDIESDLDSDYDNFSFLNHLATLKYRINDGNVVTCHFVNKTPATYSKGLYLDLDGDIGSATSIWFEFVIRNHKYIYSLKQKILFIYKVFFC